MSLTLGIIVTRDCSRRLDLPSIFAHHRRVIRRQGFDKEHFPLLLGSRLAKTETRSN